MRDKESVVKDFLAHHGIKGMKWGVKTRSRGAEAVSVKTGTNPVGKTTVKTGGGKRLPAHPDAIAAKVIQQKLAKSGSHSLSNDEIQKVVTRHNLEQQVSRLPKGSGHLKAAKHISSVLKSPQGQMALNAATETIKNDKVQKAIKVAASLR